MNLTVIHTEVPKCRTCGIEMKEWVAFAKEQEHAECRADRISKIIVEKAFKDFKL